MRTTNLRIYYTSFNERIAQSNFLRLNNSLPPMMRERGLRYKKLNDAYAYVLGRKLIEHILVLFESEFTLNDIKFDFFMRPNIHNFYDFNISHSNNIVVCIVAETGNVGIDIEFLRQLEILDFTSHFSCAEVNMIFQADSPLNRFYECWTAKEAALKAIGSGLTNDLRLVDVSNLQNVFLDEKIWYLHKITNFSNYICHVATSEPSVKCTLTDLTSLILSNY